MNRQLSLIILFAVSMIVETESSIQKNPFAINDSTDSQTTVLKTLHENNKGVFIWGKPGKGHLAKKVGFS